MVREGHFRQHALYYGDPIEETVRTTGFERPTASSAPYVVAFLTGIPSSLMPEDRAFTAQDLQRMESVCFVVPEAAVRERVEEILAAPNLGWRKIRFLGRELVTEGVDVEGEYGRVSGCPLLELAEISVFYNSVDEQALSEQGTDQQGTAGRERPALAPESRTPGADESLKLEMVEVRGGTFIAWELPEQAVPPPVVVVRELEGTVHERIEEDEDPPEPR